MDKFKRKFNKTIKVYDPKDHWEFSKKDKFEIMSGDQIYPLFQNESIFEMVDNLNDSDIVVYLESSWDADDFAQFIRPFIDAKVKLLILGTGIMHIEEFLSVQQYTDKAVRYDQYQQKIPDMIPVLILHTNSHPECINISFPSVQYTDFLWNRSRAFFSVQPKNLFFPRHGMKSYTCPWYPNTTGRNRPYEYYALSDLDQVIQKQHHGTSDTCNMLGQLYVSMNCTRNAGRLNSELTGFSEQQQYSSIKGFCIRDVLRTELVSLLEHYPGYLSNPQRGAVLIGEGVDPSVVHYQISYTSGMGMTPANNAYYDNSILSIYIETLSYGDNVKCVTEKTWEPLIKGHFILPFGYSGLIHDLQHNYNMKMPEWIDYSYDSEKNDLVRWTKYLMEIKRVLGYGYRKLFEHKCNDIEILKHNRNMILIGKSDNHSIETAIEKSGLNYYLTNTIAEIKQNT